MKFENLIRELIAQRDAELVEGIEALKKDEFNSTYDKNRNAALDEALQIIKGTRDV